MPPTRAVLDCNVFDQLEVDEAARLRTRDLCNSGDLEIIVPETVYEELKDSPFEGIPDWFPTATVPDGVFVVGHSRLGAARLGVGRVYLPHLGTSGQVPDAVIVDTADVDADLFVSQDDRARKRYAQMGGRALDYARFRIEILGLS